MKYINTHKDVWFFVLRNLKTKEKLIKLYFKDFL